MDLQLILDLAKKHSGMNSSAELCYIDALACSLDPIRAEFAAKRALKSLAHSVGVFHDDYFRALKEFE